MAPTTKTCPVTRRSKRGSASSGGKTAEIMSPDVFLLGRNISSMFQAKPPTPPKPKKSKGESVNERRSSSVRDHLTDPEKQAEREKTIKRRVTNIPHDPDAQRRLAEFIWKHPVDSIKQFFGVELWDKQIEIVESVRKNHFTTVRSGNAVGKTFVVSLIAILFMMTHNPGYVILTSAGWREVEKVLWPQIQELNNRLKTVAKFPIGVDPLTNFWYPDPKNKRWGMIGVAAKDKNNFAGFHNADVLVIGDEADGIALDIIEAIFGNTTGENDRVLLTGNPHTPGSAFHETFSSEIWNAIHISCLDHPNVVTGKEVIKGAVTQRWVNAMKKELGEDTPAYSSRVRGDFPEADELQLIPLSWIEMAGKRDGHPPDLDTLVLGVDVARSQSGDDTVFFIRDMFTAHYLKEHKGMDTMAVVGMMLQLARKWRFIRIYLDSSNMGWGVFDRAREMMDQFELAGVKSIVDINFGSNAENKKRFKNSRAECFWGAREMLHPSNDFAIPDKQILRKLLELSVPRLKPASDGRVQLESKDDIKERLKGRSPDRADAFALTCSPRSVTKSTKRGSQKTIDFSGFGRG